MARIIVNNPRQVINGGAKKYYFKVKGLGGPKGDKGDKGDTGSQGPRGPQGDPCTVVVNSTATLEPGSSAYVTNTGSLSNAVLNFGIPQGPRGPQGIRGERGEAGQKGDTGPRGPQGERGTNATVTVGTTITTEPGTQAYAWNSSSNPSNAVINFDIPRGATGPQGPTGPAGQNFTPTIVAELPTTGTESKLYLTPKAHTTQTATGNPINVNITDGAGSMESFRLDGDTFQQTYTGKNLFNDATATNSYIQSNGSVTPNDVWRSSQLIKVEPNTRYTWHGEVYGVLQVVWAGYDSSQAFISGQYAQVNNVDSLTIITGVNTEYIRVGYRSDGMRNMQLELGSTATPYEPYVGGQPSPSPSYPQAIQTVTGEQTVEIVGKNLFDATATPWVQNVAYNNTGQQNWAGYYGIDEYQPVEASTQYTFSNDLNKPIHYGIAYYNSSKALISTTIADTTTFTTPANCAYIRFAIESSTAPTWTQLELGSTATSYAPYSKQTLPISLGSIELCKLDTYQDYIYKDGESWKVHKAIGQIVFDSSTPWFKHPSTGANIFLLSGTGFIGYRYNIGQVAPAKMNTDRVAALGSGMDGSYGLAGITDDSQLRVFRGEYDSAYTARIFNEQMVGNYIYGALVTPTDTTITDQTLIAQLEAIRTASLENSTNTITNSAAGTNLAGDMEISYYGYNPTNRYDKFIWLDLNNNYEQIGS